MKNYTVEMIQTETFIVNTQAEDEKEAADKATILFSDGDYKEIGDCTVNIGKIYQE